MQLNKVLNNTKKNSFICFLGLSFKENTDDIRFSQPLKLVDALIRRNYKNLILCDKLAFDRLKNIYEKKNIKILKKPKYSSNIKYILCNKDGMFLRFLNKIPNKQIIDLKYTINKS